MCWVSVDSYSRILISQYDMNPTHKHELSPLVLGALSDWFLVDRKGFGPQGVKQVVIFKFVFVWIKGRLTFIIIKGKA